MKVTAFAVLVALIAGATFGVYFANRRVQEYPNDPVTVRTGVTQPDRPEPRLKLDSTEYDCGTMSISDDGSHVFHLTNEGSATLTLTDGGKSSERLGVQATPETIEPGKSGEITLRWSPTAEEGPFRYSATYFANDPKLFRFDLVVKGTVQGTLRVIPKEAEVDIRSAEGDESATFRVLNFRQTDFAVSAVEYENKEIEKYFEAKITPLSSEELKASEAKSGSQLVVTVKPGLPQGAFQQKIRLRTNAQPEQDTSVVVQGTAPPEIRILGRGWDADKNTFHFGSVKSVEGGERKLTLLARGAYRKQIQYKLAAAPRPFAVRIGETKEIKDGQLTQTELYISIPKGEPTISRLGVPDEELPQVTIETTHPNSPKLEFRIRYSIE